MASLFDIKAGGAFVEIYTKNALDRGLKAAQKRLQGFATTVTAIGKRMMIVSGFMSMPFVAGAKIATSFEEQMARVSTVLDEPEKHLDRFRKGVRKLSENFGESTETLSQGLFDILSASISPEHALGVLETAAKSARAGLTDTGTAADGLTTMLNAFGLSADRASDAADLLFNIDRRGKTTFAELAESIGMVATTAATSGMSLEEFGAMLATMTRHGVKTENAVTSLNAIVSSFLSPTQEAADYARSLGFEMSTTTLRSEGLVGVFQRIQHLPADSIAKLFTDVRAIRGAMPVLQNMPGFLADMAAMSQRAGAANAAFAKMSGTLSFQLARLKQKVVSILAVIGDALLDDLNSVANAIARVLDRIHKFVTVNKAWITTAAKAALVVGAVGTAFLAFGLILKVIAVSMGGFATMITLLVGGLKLAATVAAGMLIPFRLAGKLLVYLGKAFGLVGIATLGIGKGLRSAVRVIRELGLAALASASSVSYLQGPLKIVTAAFATARKGVIWFIKPFDDWITKMMVATAMTARIAAPVKQLGVVSMSTGTALATLNTSLATVSKSTKLAAVGTTILGFKFLGCNMVTRKTGSAIKFLLAPLRLLGRVAKVAGSVLLSTLLRPLSAASFVFKAFGSVIAGLFSPIGLLVAAIAGIGIVLANMSGLGGKAMDWLASKFHALKEVAVGAWKGIGNALAKGDIALAGKILWLSLKLVFQHGVNSLMSLWIGLKSSMLGIWIDLKTGVQKLWQDLWFMLKEVAIKTGFAEPILKTFHALESGWLGLTQFFTKLWYKMCSGVTKAWNRVSHGIKSVQGWISERVVDTMAFFDESIDADQAKKIVREKFEGDKRGLDNELKQIEKEQADNEKELAEQQARQQINLDREQTDRFTELDRQKQIGNAGRQRERDDAKKAIDDARTAEQAALAGKTDSDLAESAKALDDARRAWKDSLKMAADPVKDATKSSQSLTADGRFEEAKQKLQNAAPKIEAASSATGTFSAAFAGRLTGGTAAARTADAIEKLLEEQRRHNKLAEKSGKVMKFVATGPATPLET